MNPISKQFGFYLLSISALVFGLCGEGYAGLFLAVSALFYDAIKKD